MHIYTPRRHNISVENDIVLLCEILIKRDLNERRISMSKSYAFFTLASLGGAIFFFNSNALIALLCLALFVGCCYGAGLIG